MAKWWARLKSNKAESTLNVLVLLFVVLLLFAVFLEFAMAMAVAKQVTDTLDRAILNVATDNAYNSYNGFREEGSAATYYIGEDNWETEVERRVFYTSLREELGVSQNENEWIAYNGNDQVAYVLTDLEIRADRIESMDQEDTIQFYTTATVRIPIRLLNEHFYASFPIHLESRWRPKF